jgi:uncharacterized protein (TIGR03437 family)
VAYEVTVRNDRTGYGDVPARVGEEFGSKRRLQAVMNMGPLNQYPSDPAGIVQARSISGDTPMSILGHEAGHLFLAFASVRDPDDPRARPMLGRQGAHWNFTFNSEASLLEGNRIRDNGPNARPRFMTVATVEGFSALDQYLMGFRALEEVPPTFLVVNADISPGRTTPQSGVPINGERRDIRVEEIVQAEGRRTPDHTVSQRRFRFAFLLVVPRGAQPSADDLARLETYRREFETYFARVTSTRAVADTTLVRSLRLSVFPAAGVLAGGSLQASVSLEKPAPADLTVLLRTQNGNITAPPSVTIPAGASVATFPIRGVRAGVDDLAAEPGDNRYSAAYAKVQVSSASDLNLTLVSGSGQRPTAGTPLSEPIEVRLTDINNLPYPDVRVQASVNAGGRVEPAVATTGEDGIARFRWTPGTAESSELRASLEGNSAVSVTANTAGPRVVLTTGGVLNAASFTQPIAPGSIVSLFGAQFSGGASQQAALPLPETLAGVQVQINGRAARLYFVSDGQINLVVPPETTPGPAEIVVITPDGPAVPVRITVMETAPGIFFDAVTGEGAVLPARPRAGDVIEIYATGLGATRVAPLVTIGGVPAEILFSGAAPGFPGMNQVNARVPAGAGSGTVKLAIEAGERRSNEVTLELR